MSVQINIQNINGTYNVTLVDEAAVAPNSIRATYAHKTWMDAQEHAATFLQSANDPAPKVTVVNPVSPIVPRV